MIRIAQDAFDLQNHALQELKRYDTDWKKQFKVLPNHSQKEVMRPLYLYYRRLKNQLASADSGGAREQDSDDDLLARPGSDSRSGSNKRSSREKAEQQIGQLEASHLRWVDGRADGRHAP
eukprot:g1479.t1